MLVSMKLGAGQPCKIDIAIIAPHSLKSPLVSPNVDCIGFPSQKNRLSMNDVNSASE